MAFDSKTCFYQETVKIERRHTTDGSFEKTSKAYVEHPKSVEKQPATPTPSGISSFASHIRKTALDTIESGAHTPVRWRTVPPDVIFLTKDELENARELYVAGQSETYENLDERVDVLSTRDCDHGLRWLYESDVTFVDTSEGAKNNVRNCFLAISDQLFMFH